MNTARVLVTGASGFIGLHALAALRAAGLDVTATYCARPPGEIAGVRWVHADLLALDAPEALIRDAQPDTLLHLAWIVEPGRMIDHVDNLRWLAASLDLLRHFHAAGGRRCVMSGSCYEYDWRYGYCSEELTPGRPDTLYGAAKRGLAETMLAYCKAAGLSGAWGRLFFLYGPHENPRRLVPAVILSLLRGEPAKSSHGKQVRDYMHVRDAADGLIALLLSDSQGIFNIASGCGVAIHTIVERIGGIVGREELLQIGALPARANDLPLVVGDAGKIRRDVGWHAQIDLDAGLRATVDWWRARQKASPR